MHLIGLTGGIGSGKSTVASVFSALGIPVYNSDSQAKMLMNTDKHLQKKIMDLLGSEAYHAETGLNRQWIAQQVFNNKRLLAGLNEIVHPAVHHDLIKWSAQHANAPFLIQESAIVFEEQLEMKMESVILVLAPEDLRIQRVIQRDIVDETDVRNRMKQQWADDLKIPFADFIIYNDGHRSIISQARDIYQMIIASLQSSPVL